MKRSLLLAVYHIIKFHALYNLWSSNRAFNTLKYKQSLSFMSIRASSNVFMFLSAQQWTVNSTKDISQTEIK